MAVLMTFCYTAATANPNVSICHMSSHVMSCHVMSCHVCMYVCLSVCMYVCMYVSVMSYSRVVVYKYKIYI